MLTPSEIASFDESEDTAELLRALPDLRDNLNFARNDEELGLRSLLDWPDPNPPARGNVA